VKDERERAKKERRVIPRALTVAGSDSGGGAGIQADLKTFAALGVFGTSALTAITAQNTRGVTGVHVLPPEFVREQIKAVVSDIGVDAAKTGMLATAEIVRTVADLFQTLPLERLVVDPVMRAANGDPLLEKEAEQVLVDELLPRAEIVTPNSYEAAAIAGIEVQSVHDMEEAARRIARLTKAAVVVKGGRIGGEGSPDLLLQGGEITWLDARRILGPAGAATHGAGCSFSAAIAANRALGRNIIESVREAKRFVTEAIRRSVRLGEGIPPGQPMPLGPSGGDEG
jgi:hydroxymethylpyrimidine/phosphomethylpyrimidine kinase